MGDLVLENKVLFYLSPERTLMLSGGVDIVLPTGSSNRGLGGAVGFAPFAVVGFKVGGFDVLADIAYRILFRPKSIGGDLQQLTTGIAVAHPLTRRLAPFVELTTVTNVNAQQGADERLVGRPQVYVGPGLNIRIRPGLDFVLGIQAPLSDARHLMWAVGPAWLWISRAAGAHWAWYEHHWPEEAASQGRPLPFGQPPGGPRRPATSPPTASAGGAGYPRRSLF